MDTTRTLTAWRACRPDLTSSRGYRWPYPGQEAVAPLPDGRRFSRGNACPTFEGDGLCLAKTWQGAASGGIPATTCLEVTYLQSDVLGEDDDKIRVSRCQVVELYDATAFIRAGWFTSADLRYANLRYADLTSADLTYADLTSAGHNEWTRWPHGFDVGRLA